MDPLTPNTAAFLDYLSNTTKHDPSMSYFTTPDALAGQAKLPAAPTSLPPSAFFSMPVPGRDTPEDTPESSNAASVSPEAPAQRAMTSDSDEEAGQRGGKQVAGTKASGADHTAGKGDTGMHKRKAGHGHTVVEESDDDEDSGSDNPAGHEDKRQHANGKAAPAPSGSGRRGGRKSVEEGSKGSREMSKAEKRKEQNRAAQKAFRERREAKVKDLEDQIAGLEAKSFGVSVENENLRGILKRLQEENVALKKAAFTFSMPVNGNGAGSSSKPGSGFNTPSAQNPKPPTPPQSVDDTLRSIHDPPLNAARKSSGMGASPESLVSVTSRNSVSTPSDRSPPTFDPAETFNAFAMGVRPEWGRQLEANKAISASALSQLAQNAQRTLSKENINQTTGNASGNANGIGAAGNAANANGIQTGPSAFAGFSGPSSSTISPLSSGSDNKADLDALFASFYPGAMGADAVNGDKAAQSTTANGSSQFATSLQQATNPGLPNGNFGAPSNGLFNTPNSINMFSSLPSASGGAGIDRMAFRDQIASAPQRPQQDTIDWANLNDDNVDEFLASLSGGDPDFANGNANGSGNLFGSMDQGYDLGAEEDFNVQLQKLLDASTGASPGSAFFVPPASDFNVSNYLNMSPSPLPSLSNSQSPASHLGQRDSTPLSNSASPGSSGSSHPSTANTSTSAFMNSVPIPQMGVGAGLGQINAQTLQGQFTPQQVQQLQQLQQLQQFQQMLQAQQAQGMGVTSSGAEPVVQGAQSLDDKQKKEEVARMAAVVAATGKPGEVVQVVGEDGKVLKPSELWVRMGMQHTSHVNDLIIDDLCDQMKAKATCKDGHLQLSVSDAETMFKSKAQHGH